MACMVDVEEISLIDLDWVIAHDLLQSAVYYLLNKVEESYFWQS